MNPQQEILKIGEEYALRRRFKKDTLKNIDTINPDFGNLFLDTDSNTLYVCLGRINGKFKWVPIENEHTEKILRNLK